MRITLERLIKDADAMFDMASAELKYEGQSIEHLSKLVFLKLLGKLSLYSPETYKRIFDEEL